MAATPISVPLLQFEVTQQQNTFL